MFPLLLSSQCGTYTGVSTATKEEAGLRFVVWGELWPMMKHWKYYLNIIITVLWELKHHHQKLLQVVCVTSTMPTVYYCKAATRWVYSIHYFRHPVQHRWGQLILNNLKPWNQFCRVNKHHTWSVNWDTFPQSSSGMLQNGGSSGAAGALQQEMNSDIRAVDLGAPTASWEIMALRREMTHVTPMKTQLGS